LVSGLVGKCQNLLEQDLADDDFKKRLTKEAANEAKIQYQANQYSPSAENSLKSFVNGMSSVLRAFLAIFTSVGIQVHQKDKAFPTTIQRKVTDASKEIRDLVSKMTFGDLEDMGFIFPARVVEPNNLYDPLYSYTVPMFLFPIYFDKVTDSWIKKLLLFKTARGEDIKEGECFHQTDPQELLKWTQYREDLVMGAKWSQNEQGMDLERLTAVSFFIRYLYEAWKLDKNIGDEVSLTSLLKSCNLNVKVEETQISLNGIVRLHHNYSSQLGKNEVKKWKNKGNFIFINSNDEFVDVFVEGIIGFQCRNTKSSVHADAVLEEIRHSCKYFQVYET
jgi:hypothetical protein